MVPVILGLSFAAADQALAPGHNLDDEPIYAVISPAERYTLVSKELALRLDRSALMGTIDYQSVNQKRGRRARYVVTIHIEGFAPRSIDVIATELFAPLQCIIGRDLLSVGWFTYRGSDGEFRLRLPGP